MTSAAAHNTAEYAVLKKEITHNTRWTLWEAEKVADKTKILLIEFTQQAVGSLNIIRKNFEQFQRLHTLIGDSIIHATTLLPSFNTSVAVVYSYRQDRSVAFQPVLSYAPITNFGDYLDIVIETLHIFWKIHKLGLIHNSISGDGLLLRTELGSREAHVCLVDMGDCLASNPPPTNVLSPEKEHQETHAGVETYKYTSPEYTGRTGNVIDQRSDIYSLGVLLYELAVGHLPFNSASNDPLELLHLHMTQAPPSLPQDLWSSSPGATTIMSNIICKMMCKAPSERYQSLYGTLRDLELVQSTLKRRLQLTPFPIAAYDLYDEFHLPNMKLYGRDKEISAIMKQVEAFQEQCEQSNSTSASALQDGTPQNNGSVVLVGGHSGVGKSSLVRHVFNKLFQDKEKRHKPPVLLEGKHDRLKHTPYSAIVKALGGVVRRLLTMSPEELVWWREKIVGAISPNGKVLLDVMPEAEAIIGSQPPVPTLPPQETRTRFELVLIAFMKVFLSKFTTILFLDDMQWADPSTLSLVESMMANTSVTNLLLVCAYRDNEVDSSHLFTIILDDMEKKNVVLNRIMLKTLKLEHTTQLIMDSFHCSQAVAHPLATLVQKRTSGNPFFMGQFLKTITQEKYGVFNYSNHLWEWSLEQLNNNSQYTDNVVDFMVSKIRKLPTDVQPVLQLASCLGNTFDLETLFVVSEISHKELERCLGITIGAGLLFTHQEARVTESGSENVTVYKFIHDRVQEAFYVMLDSTRRMPAHLKIARLLHEKLSKGTEPATQDLFFTIAHHYNEAADMVVKLPTESEERSRMIDLNLEAAKKAKQSSAIESANTYLQAARRALAPDHFKSDYRRSFDVLLLLADCEFSIGHYNEAEKLCTLLLANSKDSHDKVLVYILLVSNYESTGNLRKSIESGFEALKLYGINLSLHPSDQEVLKIKNEALALQKQKTATILDIAYLPPMSGHYQMLLEVLYTMVSTSYVLSNKAGLNLFYVVVSLACKLCIEHGPTGVSGNIFVCFAGVLGDFEQFYESYQYAVLGFKITEVIPHPASLARTECNFQGFGQWQQETITQGKTVQLNGFRHAVEVGDANYIMYTATNGAPVVLGCGEHLDDCEATTLQQLNTLRNLKRTNQDFVESIFCCSRAYRVLKGTTVVPGKFDDDFSYDKFLARMEELQSLYFVCIAFFSILFTSVIFEDYETALDVHNKTPVGAVQGLYLSYEQIVWRNLLYLAMLPKKDDPAIQASYLSKIQESMNKFQKVKNSPSLECKLLLIEAELARIEGDTTKAQDLYDASIAAAKTHNYNHIVGYASEQAMKFYLSRHMDRAATNYFREARTAYFAWGAFAKTKQLENKYLFLMSNPGSSTSVVNIGSARGTLDLQSVLKACQVLSSEIDLTKLLANMVRIVMQNTGAQKGFFVVPDPSGKLFIEAQGDAGNDEVQSVHLNISDTSTSHPAGILQYVYRTKAPVLLDDAFQGGMFTFDPYVQHNNTKSVLCIPVLGQSKVIGLLYVENNLLTGAFTTERLEVLQMLSAQMAISVENATLYKTLRVANDLLETKNKELLQLDQIKDQFLANTSHELRTPLNGIIGLAEALMDGATGLLSVATCNNLALIVNSGRRLSNLVNDILDLSALKAGSLSIHPRPCSLQHAISEVVFLSAPLIGSRDVKLIDKTSNLPQMTVDEARIVQVLQNIVGNALKFTNKGSVVISNESTDDWLRINVTDTGCGIPQESLESIFEDFKQVDGSTSREVGGTGLGLSISKRLMELHGGHIAVESQVGAGSTFTIMLPQNLGTVLKFRQCLLNPIDPSHIKESPGTWITHHHKTLTEDSKLTVLIVDDDPSNQIVSQKLLSSFNVIQAATGAEALDIINNRATLPDFLLLDVMMPSMNGLEVCEKVREKYPMCDLPIIFVSSKNTPESIAEGLRRGGNDYITKPVNKEELIARIHTQLLICHTCRMVCNNLIEPKKDEVFVCDTCKHSTPNPVRHVHTDMIASLVNQPPNAMEVLNRLPFVVTIYTQEGHAVMRNAASKALFHSLPAAPDTNEVFLPHLKDRELAQEILRQAQQGHTVEKYISEDNETEYHHLWSQLLSLASGGVETKYVLVMESNISIPANRRKTTQERKDDLISDLAHNLKSPVNGIIAFIDAMADDITSPGSPASSSALLQVVTSSAARLSRLVDEIVDYAALATKPAPNSNKPLHMGHIIESVEELNTPSITLNNIKISKVVPMSLPAVMANRPKMTMLMSYLLEVCIKYSKSKHLTISALPAKDARGVIVSVRDTERTISKDEFLGLFDPTRSNDGSVPILIVRKLVDYMGAKLSLADNGTTIQIVFPEACNVLHGPLDLGVNIEDTANERILVNGKPRRSSKGALFGPSSSQLLPQVPLSNAAPQTPTPPLPHPPQAQPQQVRPNHTHTQPLPQQPLQQSQSLHSQRPQLNSSHTLPRSHSSPHHSQHQPSHPPPSPLKSSAINSPDSEFRRNLASIFENGKAPGVIEEINEVTKRLEILKTLYKINHMAVRFRQKDSHLPFFHKVDLEMQSIDMLRVAVARRLKVEPSQIKAIVRDGDTLVERDDDIMDGMCLEIYV